MEPAFEKQNSCFSRQTFQRMINGAKACRVLQRGFFRGIGSSKRDKKLQSR
jgi:hypothetical protein